MDGWSASGRDNDESSSSTVKDDPLRAMLKDLSSRAGNLGAPSRSGERRESAGYANGESRAITKEAGDSSVHRSTARPSSEKVSGFLSSSGASLPSSSMAFSSTGTAAASSQRPTTPQTFRSQAADSLEATMPFDVMVMKNPFGMQVKIFNDRPVVERVLGGSPAEDAGVLKGFVLAKIDDKNVTQHDWFDAFRTTKPPFTLTFEIKVLKASVKNLEVGSLALGLYHTPEGSPFGDDYQDFWCNVAMLPLILQISASQGRSWARVETVVPGSEAELCGVRAGDVLVAVACQRVTSLTWYAALSAATVPVLLHFRRPTKVDGPRSVDPSPRAPGLERMGLASISEDDDTAKVDDDDDARSGAHARIEERSVSRLQYLLKGGSSAKDLESAIAQATSVGVSGLVLQEAQEKLKQLEEKSGRNAKVSKLKMLLEESTESTAMFEEASGQASKLKNVFLEGSSEAAMRELEQCLKEAAEAGAPDDVLQQGRASLYKLTSCIRAKETLHIAMGDGNAEVLELAIAHAREERVPEADLGKATETLLEKRALDEAHKEVQRSLEEARARGDSTSLANALVQARKLKLVESDLHPFIDSLRKLDVREKAESSLQQAITEKNVLSLRSAIEQARQENADESLIQRAEMVLRIEEPKEKSRLNLVVAIQKGTAEALRAAIADARANLLEPCEYSVAEDLLEREERKELTRAVMNRTLLEVQHVNTSSLSDVKQAKESLSKAIAAAQEAGVCETSLVEAQKRRRTLHNIVEDLKGSIRVYCRVRPLDPKEMRQGDISVIKQLDGMSLSIYARDDVSTFSFDAVFCPGSQEEIFDNCRDLVQSAIDGYNVTMFAYGQTGAGKTFTVSGPPGCHDGIAPRTIQEVFRVIARSRDRIHYVVTGSFCELYRNDLMDLLAKPSNPKEIPPKLNVRNEKSGFVYIDGLVQEECRDCEELMEVLHRGTARRKVAATTMNSESSRSHSIFTIRITSLNNETREEISSKILVCDLAGSERLKKCEAMGPVQKDAIEINKALTALGDVIEALTKKQKQIPYRNHKLTQVMSDSLGGSAKTLMFVNCSPASCNADETLMSLRFSTRAKHVTNNTLRNRSSISGQPTPSSAGYSRSPRTNIPDRRRSVPTSV